MAASEQAHTKMTADDREVSAAWERQFQAIAKLDRRLQQLGDSQKRQSQQSQQSFRRSLEQVTGYSLGIEGAISAMQRLIELHVQYNRESQQKSVDVAGQRRAVALQMGLTGDDRRQFEDQLTAFATRRGLSDADANAFAQQAVSSGVSRDNLFGVLEELVTVRQVAPEIGGQQADPATLTRAFTQWLKASGLDLNQANAQRARDAFVSQFISKDIQTGELGDLAKIAPGLSQAGLTLEQQMAVNSSLDILGSPERSTALRNFFSRNRTIKGNKRKEAALDLIGLTPDDLFTQAGDDPFRAIENLQRGLSGVNNQTRATVLKALYEEAGVDPAELLIANVGKIRAAEKEIAAGGQLVQQNLGIYYGDQATAAERQQTESERLDASDAAVRDATFRGYLGKKVKGVAGGPAGNLATTAYDYYGAAKSIGYANPVFTPFFYIGDKIESALKNLVVKVEIETPAGEVKPDVKQAKGLSR